MPWFQDHAYPSSPEILYALNVLVSPYISNIDDPQMP